MTNGFLRVASASPVVSVGNVKANVARIKELIDELENKGVDVVVFPELSITGYTCADLFHTHILIEETSKALVELCDYCKIFNIDIIVGAPLFHDSKVYNSAVYIGKGVMNVVDKTYLPNYNEFYEKRWFAAGENNNVVIKSHGVSIGIEICEDLWAPVPPSFGLCTNGAEVIFNLSASDDSVGKYDYLKQLIVQQSARCLCGYVYSSAGWGESSTDLVYSPKNIVAECGNLLVESKRFESHFQSSYVIADIDIDLIRRERLHNMTFNVNESDEHGVKFVNGEWNYEYEPLYRSVSPTPFIPENSDGKNDRFDEIISIQVSGLAQRLKVIGCKSLTIGISGGLDSTLALIIAVITFDVLNLPRRNIIGVTMPGFGTTGRTYNNALKLMKYLGVTVKEVPIADAVMQHFKDIQHDPAKIDVTYENAQARERTQILMDIANQTDGIVLGTGDLSELALGWATYNGDHMSMYGVNAGVPKTLVKYLVGRYADTIENIDVKAILSDILDTPISPELTPADSNGTIAQKTEDLVGPYELHDFFLYYSVRFGFSPRKIYMLAKKAFAGKYSNMEILKWMEVFFRRFFTQQFKRSCMPDGVKIGKVCLSPRGDWRMPSDASSALWLEQIAQLKSMEK